MEITIEIDSNQKIVAYEYGFITFSGNKGFVSSKEHKGGQIMIFVSLQQFLYEITPLLKNKKEFVYVFQGIDTSGFQICFRCQKRIVTVSCQDQIIDIASSEKIYKDICHSLTKICLDYVCKMDENNNYICKEIIESVCLDISNP